MKKQLVLVRGESYRTLTRSFAKGVPQDVTDREYEVLLTRTDAQGVRFFRDPNRARTAEDLEEGHESGEVKKATQVVRVGEVIEQERLKREANKPPSGDEPKSEKELMLEKAAKEAEEAALAPGKGEGKEEGKDKGKGKEKDGKKGVTFVQKDAEKAPADEKGEEKPEAKSDEPEGPGVEL